jgi:hypothetical protein
LAQKATVADLASAGPVTTRVNRFAERRAEQIRSIVKGANDIGAAAAQGKITNPKQSSKGFGDARQSGQAIGQQRPEDDQEADDARQRCPQSG